MKPIFYGIKFMFPNPLQGSACKRMNLFLPLTVSKNDIDIGIWGLLDQAI